MRTQNGIILFDKNEQLPPLPGPVAPPKEQSKFGYKLAGGDGKWHWVAASEQDYRESEAQRLGVAPEEIDLSRIGCWAVSPQNCGMGDCAGVTWCTRVFNHEGNYWYCACA